MKLSPEEILILNIQVNPKKICEIQVDQITHSVAQHMILSNGEKKVLDMIPMQFKDEEFYICYLWSKAEDFNRDRMLLNVPEVLRTPAVLMAAVEACGSALQHVPPESMTNDLILAAVKSEGNALNFVPSSLRTVEIYSAALTGLGGFDTWPMIPTDIQNQADIQLEGIKAIHRDHRDRELVDFVRKYAIKSSNTDLKITAIQLNKGMLGEFPDLEQFELMGLYIRNNGFPRDWFKKELPEDPAKLMKLAVKETNKALQVALLHSIPGASLETLVPLAKAARSDDQKNLLRRLFGSREVLLLLSSDDKALARWFSEDLNL